jgi:hypothetical protein
MQNEIEFKLKQVNEEIAKLENGIVDSEVLTVSSTDFLEGYLHSLYVTRDWLQDMVTNFCD